MSEHEVRLFKSFAVPQERLWAAIVDHEGMRRWLLAPVRVINGPPDGGAPADDYHVMLFHFPTLAFSTPNIQPSVLWRIKQQPPRRAALEFYGQSSKEALVTRVIFGSARFGRLPGSPTTVTAP